MEALQAELLALAHSSMKSRLSGSKARFNPVPVWISHRLTGQACSCLGTAEIHSVIACHGPLSAAQLVTVVVAEVAQSLREEAERKEDQSDLGYSFGSGYAGAGLLKQSGPICCPGGSTDHAGSRGLPALLVAFVKRPNLPGQKAQSPEPAALTLLPMPRRSTG